ncbi:MAG: putative nucleotidyltransferase substrate binding domain-containing protein, partial [Planctomycetaceae bacterium]
RRETRAEDKAHGPRPVGSAGAQDLSSLNADIWERYRADLSDLVRDVKDGRRDAAQGRLAKRVAGALREFAEPDATLYPVEIEIDNDSRPHATVLHIRSEDTTGFLYELCNALSMSGTDISRVIVSSQGHHVFDTLHVTDAAGRKIDDEKRLRELRAAVVLIKHFTHLLPRSPNPEKALFHFREFLQDMFERPDWLHELSEVNRSDVLRRLARLLGVSDFLWEDFLRLQHENLFPVLRDTETLARRKTKAELDAELDTELAAAASSDERRDRLNVFKDREMFRTDLRHIMGIIGEFGRFSAELTDLAEVVVAAAGRLCETELQARYGRPMLEMTESPRAAPRGCCPMSICALGKCGGRELGYASDVELMFLYEGAGRTEGPESIANAEFFPRLVETFRQTIRARQEGIFQIDLRLRPYGRAGSLAVTLDAFRSYFAPDGPAWPYERQSLVKLRPITGAADFGRRIVQLRDELIYTGEPFDAASMRAMREKQINQLVQAGTFNAKLSPGGLVDCEYIVQGLQITHGHRDAALRTTNTLEALHALSDAGVISARDAETLRDAYVFLRRLIDALRMVRGHARDLTAPPAESEEFEFLARRLGHAGNVARFKDRLDRATADVQQLGSLLEN